MGTSAGGIEALRAFFGAMPAESGMAFVVILHLQRDRQSHLAEILARSTQMPVEEVTAAVRIKADHVYVIPPDKVLELNGETLELSELPEAQLQRKPVDAFFRSLAAACGPRAVAIVMSGTGGNGSMGVRDVKLHGGVVLAQDPAEAKYDNMPRHTIATGTVDQVLGVEQMPAVLQGYAQHAYVQQDADDEAEPDAEEWQRLGDILALLRTRTGRELRCYKKSTLLRRTLRRMGLRHITDFEAYHQVLRNEPTEADALAEDLMIGVTSFFRDAEAWEALREKVITKLVKECQEDQPIRVWVPGCSSGEEAYSAAILLHEEARKAKHRGEIKVFASDTATQRLQQAREGVFPDSIEADVPPDLLQRYFEPRDESYRIRSTVRESVVFASHDLLSDPPFSQIDLVSCRNLLIYLEPETQARVLAVLHFALRPGGYMFLGTSETARQQADLFEPVDKKYRIYRRVGPTRHDLVRFPMYGDAVGQRELQHLASRSPTEVKPRLDRLVHRTLAAAYAPAGVLVTQNFQALYFHGSTHPYLVQPSGEQTANVLEMAREGLRSTLRKIIVDAVAGERKGIHATARVQRDGRWRPVRLTAMPLRGGPDDVVLVTFEEPAAQPAPEEISTEPVSPGDDQNETVRQLEEELRYTRVELQATIEELENANEEQKASNEQLSSINEEYQSTNEELETSKEELQSLNEELTTVNQQLHSKVDELESANNDLQNLLASTNVATIFLDREFRLRWFSPTVRELISVLDSDVGRSLTDFVRKFDDPDLLDDAGAVMQNLTPRSREIRTEDGRWCIRRVLPYRTHDDRIEGTVITFNDVTELKQAQSRERMLATVVRDSNDAVIVVDLEGNIREWNHGATRVYGWTEQEAVGRDVRQMAQPEEQDRIETMLARLAGGHAVESADLGRVCKDGREVTVWTTASLVRDDAGEPTAVALTERDVTELRAAQRQLEAFNEELEQRVQERTALAEQRAEQLRAMSLELFQAEETERRRIAQVLHDELQQLLAAARLALGRLRQGRDEDADERFEHLNELFEMAMSTTRELSHELSPPILQEGLLPALEWARRWCEKHHGLPIDLQTDADAEPEDSKLRYPLFSACRELLFNIVKHAGTDEAALRAERAGQDIRITISDRGRGFDPEESYQHSEGRFGLFAIQERIRSLGGQMQIDSAPGQGTRITLTLPDHAPPDAEQSRQETAVSHAAPAAATASTNSAIRVLLVDDHAMMREGLATLLEGASDVEVVGEADSGEQALELVGKLQPRVVLMDVSMPGIGGVEATRRIRQQHPDVAVIGVSMHDPADRAAAMKEAGAADYAQKTAPAEQLIAAIREAVGVSSESDA